VNERSQDWQLTDGRVPHGDCSIDLAEGHCSTWEQLDRWIINRIGEASGEDGSAEDKTLHNHYLSFSRWPSKPAPSGARYESKNTTFRLKFYFLAG
jgi:hypothetical protein